MKAKLNVFLIIFLTGLLTGCTFISERAEGIAPSKNYITRDYQIKDFNSIDATTVGDIYYTQSTDGKSSLQIYGPDNFVKLIQVSVKSNTLILAMDKHKKIKNAKKLKKTYKMKAKLNVFLIIFLTGLLTGCTFISERAEGIAPSKNYITRDYQIKDFNSIDATTVGDIYYTQSTDGKSSLQIYGPDNFVKLIQVSVKSNTLILAMDKHKKIKNAKKLKITISSPDLNRIQFKGVGNIHIDNKFVTGRLDIESKGVGDVNVQELDCQNLTVNSMGVGNVNLKGKVVNANLSSKGVGDVEATDLEATHVKASSNGVGNISCNATQSLDAAVKGVGSINYKGNPAQKTFSKKGVGSIKGI